MIRLLSLLSFGRILLFACVWFFVLRPTYRMIYGSVILFYSWMVP